MRPVPIHTADWPVRDERGPGGMLDHAAAAKATGLSALGAADAGAVRKVEKRVTKATSPLTARCRRGSRRGESTVTL
jgi:hypothetical protein